MTTAEIIRLERQRNRITMPELADLIGTHPQLIGKWERGECEPSAYYIREICRALGVSADYLLGLKEEDK